MKIEKIVLHKSKRLAFNDIETLTYTPEKIHQLILGTNGSGKSSLMSELSPLPASPQDYFLGGYKTIEITHRGKTYKLHNDFSAKGGGKHNFLCDGEELNPGGTVTVQKQLVLEHFQLDTELFELLTGVITFREMNQTNRRRWLVRMADDNMDKAIEFYNKIKSEYKSTQAVLKHVDNQLTEIQMTDTDFGSVLHNLEQMKQQHADLIEDLQTLSQSLPVFEEGELAKTIGMTVEEITNLTSEAHKHYRQDRGLSFYTEEENNQRLQQLTIDKALLINRMKEWRYESAEIAESLQALRKVGAGNIGEVKSKINYIESEIIIQHSKIVKYELDGEKLPQLVSITDSVKSTLLNILESLPDNSDGRISKQQFNDTKVKKEGLYAKLTTLNQQKVKGEHILSHFNEDNKSTCPKCKHSYYLSVPEGLTKDKTVDRLNEINQEISETTDEINKCDDYLEQVSAYMTEYRRLTDLMSSVTQLDPLWEEVRKIDLSTTSPRVINDLLGQWERELQTNIDLHRLRVDLSNLQDTLKSLNDKTTEETSTQSARYEELKRLVEAGYEGIKQNEITYQQLEAANKWLAKRDELLKAIPEKISQLNKHEEEYELMEIRKFIIQETAQAYRHLAKIQDDILDIEKRRSVYSKLSSDSWKLRDDLHSYKVMLDELSPSTGLIAEYSLNFVTQFTDRMNEIINQIWTYDMQIKPTVIGDDLTYKFPLYMADSDTETPDINRASTAQKGVIDFAFKLLLIDYLGLEDYPLYIDELTPNLDEAHRINIMAYVREFVEAGKCSQMFMISHYVEGNNVFPTADFVIINDDNLLNKPMSYNAQVEITYQ